MAKDWIMVRVERSTRRELERVRQSMLTGEMMGLSELSKDNRDRFSLDAKILRLIAFRDKHAARSKKSRAGRNNGNTNPQETAAQPESTEGEDRTEGRAQTVESSPLV